MFNKDYTDVYTSNQQVFSQSASFLFVINKFFSRIFAISKFFAIIKKLS